MLTPPRLRALVLAIAALVPAAAAARPVTLDECLRMLRESSPRLAEYRQRLRAADATVLGAYGAFLPTFSTGFGYSHEFVGPKPASLQYNTITQEFFILDPIASRDYESYGFSISGSWTLFAGLSRWADLKASKLGREAARADLDLIDRSEEGIVVQAYFDLVQADMLVALNRQRLAAQGEQYDQTRRAFAMGAVARSDTLQASVQYGQARLTLLESENSWQVANLALAMAINAPLDELLEPRIERDPVFVEVDRARAVEAALASHPQLRASALRRDAAFQQIRAADSRRFPSLSAGYRYGWGDLSGPSSLGEFFEEDYTYSLTLGLSYSLFDGFARKSSVDQARANARIQEYALEQQRRSLLQSVESTLVTVTNARKQVEMARANIALARENLRLARERYRVGANTLLEVTNAEVDLHNAEVSEIDGIVLYLTALAELERTTGLKYGP